MAIEIGRLCVKTAGRDAGKKCVIIDIIDDHFALIDGETRRRRCNFLHLEPLNQVLKIEKDASHGDVARALKEIGIEARHTTPKPKTERPKAQRKTPEQMKAQKEEKKKIRSLFGPKKKEAKPGKKESTLEEKAGISEEKKEDNAPKAEEKSSGPKPVAKKKAAAPKPKKDGKKEG